jgi:hypothetical protein
MLKPEKRHTAAGVGRRVAKNSRVSEYDDHAGCTCSHPAAGTLGSRFIRKSLKTSNYETAPRKIAQWEGNASLDLEAFEPITVQDPVRNLGEATQA